MGQYIPKFNVRPTFFDISDVANPADRIAHHLQYMFAEGLANTTQSISKKNASGLIIAVNSGSANSGGTTALPVVVSGFNGVSTFQFSVHWDPNHVAYTGADAFGLPGLALGNFGQPTPGTLTVSWEDPTGASSSLVNGTSLFTIHFQILGPTGSSSIVSITGDPTPIEILNTQLSSLLPKIQSGTVTVAGGGNGTPVQITSQPASKEVIEGQPVTFTVVANGTAPISYQWRKNGQDLPGATGSSLLISHALGADAGIYTVVVANAFASPLVSIAATLTVNSASSNQLTFGVGSATVQLSDIAVIPFKVTRFINVSSLQFSAHWDTNQFAYVGLEQFGLTALGEGNFGAPVPGTLTLSWEDPSGGSASLPDQTVIFALRLRAMAAGSSQVSISGTPTPVEVLDGNVTPVAVTTVPGQMTIQSGPVVGPGVDGGNTKTEALTIYTAVELEMLTLTNKIYQLENSLDLQAWMPVGSAFPGTGNVTSRLISVKGNKSVYWRLRVMP